MRITDFHNVPEAETARLLTDWQNRVFSMARHANPGLLSEIKFMKTVPLHLLPVKQAVEMMSEYRKIIGLDAVLLGLNKSTSSTAEQVDSIWQSIGRRVVPQGKHSKPYGKFSLENSSNRILDRIYRDLNLQKYNYNRAVMSGTFDSPTAASYFGIGTRSVPVYHKGYEKIPHMPSQGSKILTFDIETAGLMKNQIREVSFSRGTVSAGKKLVDKSDNTIIFNPREFKRGYAGVRSGNRVGPARLQDFMRSKYGLGNALNNDQFASSMIPFLQGVIDSDHIVGQNVYFDIEQVFHQLSNTKAYKSKNQSVIPGFRDLVDKAFSQLSPESGKVIDTLVMARNAPNLAGLQVASELLSRGDGSIYSIENLLLQTDLGSRIGYKRLQELMGKGLHFGSIDLEITNALMKHMPDLQLRRLGGNPIQDEIRKAILSSKAITPWTSFTSTDQITDHVLRLMISSGDGLTAEGQLGDLLRAAARGDNKAARAAFKMMRDNPDNAVRISLNPLEQGILQNRRFSMSTLLPKVVDSSSYVFKQNYFSRATGTTRLISQGRYAEAARAAKILDSDEVFSLQDKLLRAGMPFAGLDIEERQFGTLLSGITSRTASETVASNLTGIADDLMVSHFNVFDPDNVQYFTRSGRSSMSANILSQAGLLTDGGETGMPSMLSLSSVEPTEKMPFRHVNLVYNFQNEAEVETLAEYLEKLHKSQNPIDLLEALGFSSEEYTSAEALSSVSRFREALDQGLVENLRKHGMDSGVAIGQISKETADEAIKLLSGVSGLDELTDRSMINIALPYMNHSIDQSTGRGSIRTAGAILNRNILASDGKRVANEVASTKRVYEAFKKMTGNVFQISAAKTASKSATEEGAQRVAAVYNAFTDYIRPNIGKTLLGLVGVGIGAHYYKSHKEMKQYDLAMQQMPVEHERYGVADQIQQRIDSGYNGYYQRMDPLATSYIVGELNQGKQGHSSMAWDRNNDLYGGVL